MMENKAPIINPDFLTEMFDNEILLYTVTDTKAVYLNESAHLVWQLCGDKRTVLEIIDLLEKAYPDQKDVIRSDVLAAIKTLVDVGAISFSDEQ